MMRLGLTPRSHLSTTVKPVMQIVYKTQRTNVFVWGGQERAPVWTRFALLKEFLLSDEMPLNSTIISSTTARKFYILWSGGHISGKMCTVRHLLSSALAFP